MRSKKWFATVTWSMCGVVLISLIGIVWVARNYILYTMWDCDLIAEEQRSWYPRDSARLAVLQDESYGRRGILLHVHAPSGVAQVWKPCRRWCSPRPNPWSRPSPPIPHPNFAPVPFRVLEAKGEGDVMLLVDYEFRPRQEWEVALKSRDGYWVSMSPYFPDEPDLTDEKWNELIQKSRLVVPDG